jgi:hypothetical protein
MAFASSALTSIRGFRWPHGLYGIEREVEKPATPTDSVEREVAKPAMPLSADALLARVNRIIASRETLPPPAGEHQPDSMILQGQMSLRRGSWNFYPERTEDEETADRGAAGPEGRG